VLLLLLLSWWWWWWWSHNSGVVVMVLVVPNDGRMSCKTKIFSLNKISGFSNSTFLRLDVGDKVRADEAAVEPPQQ
jgi:hypothetical protein